MMTPAASEEPEPREQGSGGGGGGIGPDGGGGPGKGRGRHPAPLDKTAAPGSSAFGVITTAVPARLDRLPWSRWHWMIVVGLGTVWILDGLEVTTVGNIASRLSEEGSGLAITSTQVTGLAAALYVAGACSGALFFGWLTDRFGRKKLFMVTLAVYLGATAMTGLSFSAWWFFLFRFLTGFGIGGEYAAINSAIDELIPSKYRGRVDLIINGSYWLGAIGGALLSIVMLNTDYFPKDLGWRLTFALGVVLGLVILLVRRHVPESPRWQLIHGHREDADKLVDSVEREIEEDKHEELAPPAGEITIHERKSIGFGLIAKTVFHSYPKRAVLGLSLFIGQAFLYNAITFGFGAILTKFFDVESGHTGYYFAVIAAGNFVGPLVLGKLFDTVGRRIMIAGTYIVPGILLFITAWLFDRGRSQPTPSRRAGASCCSSPRRERAAPTSRSPRSSRWRPGPWPSRSSMRSVRRSAESAARSSSPTSPSPASPAIRPSPSASGPASCARQASSRPSSRSTPSGVPWRTSRGPSPRRRRATDRLLAAAADRPPWVTRRAERPPRRLSSAGRPRKLVSQVPAGRER